MLPALPADLTVHLLPASRDLFGAGELLPAAASMRYVADSEAVILYEEDVNATVLAHEFGHILADVEGYPCFVGDATSGLWSNLLIDPVVDRLVDGYGLDTIGLLDRDRRRVARFPHLGSGDFFQIITFYVFFLLRPTRDQAAHARALGRIRREHPDVTLLGDEVVALLDHGKELGDPIKATAAFQRVADYLTTSRLGAFQVEHVFPPRKTRKRFWLG
jgi:hypothetical protein